MRPSWIPVFVSLIAIGCGAFALFPTRWSPDPQHGILAGMVMYFVGVTRTAARLRASTGAVPPLFGPRGLIPGALYRALGFLVVLTVMAYVYFDRRTFFDVTWPVLILASWSLADSMLNTGRREKVEV
jgi:hypothetical protein